MPVPTRKKVQKGRGLAHSALIPSHPESTRLTEEDNGVHRDPEYKTVDHTRELSLANKRLKEEIAFRKKIAEDLRKSQDEVRSLYDASRKREYLYHSFLTASPDAIVIYDAEGKSRYVSPSFSRLFGWTAEELEGRGIPYVPDSEQQHTMTLIDRVWREGVTLSGIQCARHTKDGRLLTVSMSASRYHDELGSATGILVIHRDITERKMMEEALAASEERFRTLADVSPFGIAVLSASERTEYLNPKFSEIFGYTVKDVPDLDSWFQKTYPQSAQWKRLTALWRQETAGLHPADASGAETTPRTLRLNCKDGRQRIVGFRAVVLADGRLMATFLDVTDEAIAQGELLRAKNEWERTFHAVSDLILLLDDRQRIVRINRALAERLGVAPEEVAGRGALETIPGNKTLAPLCPAGATFTEGQEYRTEVVDESLGGVFDLRISPLRDQEGHPTGSVHVARDLTALKSLEKARRLAVHHLSHELTTPVAIIQASLKKLAAPNLLVANRQEIVERVYRNLERLKAVQRAVAKIVSPPQWRARVFSLHSLVNDVLGQIREQSAHRSTVLTSVLHCQECHALDPDIFTEVINTLVKNAIENTPDQGSVIVRLEDSPAGFLLQVEDTGVGITSRDQSFIFDAFHHTQRTADYATKRPFDFNAGGKGLELMRLRMLSDHNCFSLSFRSRRCCFLPTDHHDCPGSISSCSYVSGPDDCRASGGTTFSVLFPLPARSIPFSPLGGNL
jgi:PAS domain S-box-containing protein